MGCVLGLPRIINNGFILGEMIMPSLCNFKKQKGRICDLFHTSYFVN